MKESDHGDVGFRKKRSSYQQNLIFVISILLYLTFPILVFLSRKCFVLQSMSSGRIMHTFNFFLYGNTMTDSSMEPPTYTVYRQLCENVVCRFMPWLTHWARMFRDGRSMK